MAGKRDPGAGIMTEGDIVRFIVGSKNYRVLAIHDDVAVLQPCGEAWVRRVEAYVCSLIVERPGHTLCRTVGCTNPAEPFTDYCLHCNERPGASVASADSGSE